MLPIDRGRFMAQTAAATAATPLLGLAGCAGRSSSLTPPTPGGPSRAGAIFLAHLDRIPSFPDQQLLALLKKTAASGPTPQQIEVALGMLGAYGGMKSVPTAIPPAPALTFPADHAEHFDTQFEWRYFTLSLPLSNGGLFSMLATFFRKAIAEASDMPGVSPVDRQIYSTSIAMTIEMPGQPGVHYYLPTTTFAPIDGTVTVGNAPFHLTIGKNSIVGGNGVFPLHIHVEDAGGNGRPSVVVDVDCAATNPLFLQGINGFVGTPDIGWFYYSWPQQATTGTVTLGGTSYGVTNGLCWMDHQWGGAPNATSGPAFSWSGWCWFEFQFDGNRSLTLAAPHGPIVGGALPHDNAAFGTYVEADGTATFVVGNLNVGTYQQSPETDAKYPSSWLLSVTNPSPTGTQLALVVNPVVTVQPQTMWFGSLSEYSEANCTVTAAGIVSGAPVGMSGVGYCEGVGFETPSEYQARAMAFLSVR